MQRIGLGLLCLASATLMLELTLVRVFDVIWYSNMAYMVITLAMFCFGLSGIYFSLRPLPPEQDPRRTLMAISFCFAVFSIVLLPVLIYVPFDFVMNLQHYEMRPLQYQGQTIATPTLPFQHYDIWGLTAMILYGLAERYQQYCEAI